MENTKPLVIPVILRGENYLLWSRTTKTALCGRGLWRHTELLQAPQALSQGVTVGATGAAGGGAAGGAAAGASGSGGVVTKDATEGMIDDAKGFQRTKPF